MTAKLQTVHVRVNDAATGQPTPCRVRFTDAAGTYYAPFGRLTQFATVPGEDVGGNLLLGGKTYATIDGNCEIDLPPGRIFVEVHKGPEYEPLFQEVALAPGKLALRLTLNRWTNLREQGWYSGDTRSHYLSPFAALLEGMAEDVAVVNVLAAHDALQERPRISNILEFSGQRPAVEAPGYCVVVNTLNRHPILGELALLNCHRVVYPLSFGEPISDDNWTLADWCDQCHRKSGLTIWANANTELAQITRYGWAGEALADLILGKVDALEISSCLSIPPDDLLRAWYRLLSCGFRVPLVGGSGKASNTSALGKVRTYARLGADEPFNYRNWIEAIRAGRTFITNGPILSLAVEEKSPDVGIQLRQSGRIVHARAEARGVLPFERLEIVFNGEVMASAEPSGSPRVAVAEAAVPVFSTSWIAARCWGQNRLPAAEDELGDCVYAHTSPIYIEVENRPQQPKTATIQPFLTQLDLTEKWLEEKARCDDKQRERLANILHSAREELLRRAV